MASTSVRSRRRNARRTRSACFPIAHLGSGSTEAGTESIMPSRGEEHFALEPRDDIIKSFAVLEVRENERSSAAHFLGVTLHDAEVGIDEGRKVDLVDDEQIRFRDARTTLARNLVAFGHIDDVDVSVDEFRTEGSRQVIAAA